MYYDSTVTVTDGSSIDDNNAGAVSSPESLSPLSSWLNCQGEIDAQSLRKRDFATLELGGEAEIACVSARRAEEALVWVLPPR